MHASRRQFPLQAAEILRREESRERDGDRAHKILIRKKCRRKRASIR